MAYTVTKCDVGGSTANGYHYEYLCESADDIANLPTGADSTEISRPAPGSLAFIESDSGARYILKISREWGEYPMAGGGGGTGGAVMRVTVDDVTGALVKTVREIAMAMKAGKIVEIYGDTLNLDDPIATTGIFSTVVTNVQATGSGFTILSWSADNSAPIPFVAPTLDDYPVFSDE